MTDSTLNNYISRGTNAERVAFTPSPPTPGSGNHPSYIFFETDTGNTYMWTGAAWQQVNTATGTASLSTAISTVDSNQNTSLSSTLSKVTSLSTAVSTVDSNQSSSLSQVSSSLSGAISGTASLSTAVSTVISGSISTVTSSVNSLSTAVGSGGGDLGAIHVQDQKTSGTAAGTFTTGAWQTRVLNTVVTNTITSASLATNQVSLPAGTYDVWATAPAYKVSTHRLRLRDVTNSVDLLLGGGSFGSLTDSVAGVPAYLIGRFALSGTAAVELQHRCAATEATDGLGFSATFGVSEVYANMLIRKVA